MTANTLISDPLFELQRLQRELSSRASVVHFAHSAISFLVALILACVAGKLSWDLPEHIVFFSFPFILLALSLVVYGLWRYQKGKRARQSELELFEHLQVLRKALHLDNPAQLLPQ